MRALLLLIFLASCDNLQGDYEIKVIQYNDEKNCICDYYYTKNGSWFEDSCGKFQIGDDARKYSLTTKNK